MRCEQRAELLKNRMSEAGRNSSLSCTIGEIKLALCAPWLDYRVFGIFDTSKSEVRQTEICLVSVRVMIPEIIGYYRRDLYSCGSNALGPR
jgi:hypothetical protein